MKSNFKKMTVEKLHRGKTKPKRLGSGVGTPMLAVWLRVQVKDFGLI